MTMFDPFTAGPLSRSQADKLNDLSDRVDKFDRMSVAAPLTLERPGGIPLLRVAETTDPCMSLTNWNTEIPSAGLDPQAESSSLPDFDSSNPDKDHWNTWEGTGYDESGLVAFLPANTGQWELTFSGMIHFAGTPNTVPSGLGAAASQQFFIQWGALDESMVFQGGLEDACDLMTAKLIDINGLVAFGDGAEVGADWYKYAFLRAVVNTGPDGTPAGPTITRGGKSWLAFGVQVAVVADEAWTGGFSFVYGPKPRIVARQLCGRVTQPAPARVTPPPPAPTTVRLLDASVPPGGALDPLGP